MADSGEALIRPESTPNTAARINAAERRQNAQAFLKGQRGDIHIPTLPASTALLIDMCRDVNISYKKLGTIIHSDTGLSVRILRMANSAYYGQVQSVTSVVRALTVLGLNEVRTIGLGYKIADVIREAASSSFDFESYWERSLLMAVLAREIARQMGSPLLDEAFLVGLLQDVGLILLAKINEQAFRTMWSGSHGWSDASVLDQEAQVFGTDHPTLGAELCSMWKFPDILSRGIRLQHTPPPAANVGNPEWQIHALAYAAAQMPDFLEGSRACLIVSDLEGRGIWKTERFRQIFTQAYDAFRSLSVLFERHLSKDPQASGAMLNATTRLKKLSTDQLRVFQPPE